MECTQMSLSVTARVNCCTCTYLFSKQNVQMMIWEELLNRTNGAFLSKFKCKKGHLWFWSFQD